MHYTARLSALVLFTLPAIPQQPADRLFVNGAVITMDGRGTVAQAAAIQGDRILAVGSNSDIRKLAGAATVITDLEGRALLPGFYAAHDHFPQQGVLALFQVDLNSPPIGSINTMDELVAALAKRARETPAGQWIVGRGYDDTLLREGRHPTRHDLDRASTRHPIVVIHTSGHLTSGNTRALAAAGITRDTPQPAGGAIRKDAAGEPDGVIEESNLLRRHVPELSESQRLDAIRWADRHYLSKGVTTAVIAGTSDSAVKDFETARARGDLHLRLVTMLNPAAATGAARAVKMWHDGSIQGYTGYLSQPYHRQPEGKQGYRGYPTRSRAELMDAVRKLHRSGVQIAIHGNGDAAIDEILDSYEQAQRQSPGKMTRHRIEHAQTARDDQLDRMKALGVTPSFFVGHVYYWGDRHRDLFLGPERAARISPLASALRRGIRFTIHDDTPVTPVNPIQLVWTAASRLTRAGELLGTGERIPVADALRAVTVDAAWQNLEDDRKGSLEPGKLADMVVLDRNPLSEMPQLIRNISVVETIVGGRSVWKAQAPRALKPPYPPSPVIEDLEIDWSTHKRDAPGSDNWQLTWAADDHLYGAWGDGGGFGGTNSDGRVSLGVARIEGNWDSYKGTNVWGGKNAQYPANVDGKSWGMAAVDGSLYMWVSPGSPLNVMQREARLYRSTDLGATWQPASWSFTRADGLSVPTILQFGRDYAGARDEFVYHYFTHPRDPISDSIQKPGTIYVARSPKDRLMNRDAYEFFAGMRGSTALWTHDMAKRKPVFEDVENGTGWVLSVSYNRGLKRYLLMTDHFESNRGNLGVFDAPEPWGPWTTVAYFTESAKTNFGRSRIEPNTFFWNMPSKWQSPDGREVSIVFTGSGRGQNNDSFNLVRGRLRQRGKP